MTTEQQVDRRKRVDPELMTILHEVRRAVAGRIGDDFEMILYGSRARGDARPDSDVDLMVILPDDQFDLATKRRVRHAVYDFSLETGYHFSVMVVSEGLVQERAGFKVFGALEREGVMI